MAPSHCKKTCAVTSFFPLRLIGTFIFAHFCKVGGGALRLGRRWREGSPMPARTP